MKLWTPPLVRLGVLFLVTVLAQLGIKEVIAAQAQSLSRISPDQIVKILQLPAEIKIYEPPVECESTTISYPNCSGMDRAKKLWIAADDGGGPKLVECGQMRLFRFAGTKHVNLVASICQQGPFNLPELNETKSRAQRHAELLKKDASRFNAGNSPYGQLLEDTRTSSINRDETAHIFTIFVFGHGVGYAPTAVVTNAPQNAVFVLQLFIVPDDRGPFMANLIPKINDVMELLVKELYAVTK